MKIPKIIHHIWVGGAPFPEEFAKFRQGWIDLHPDWQFMFWTDDHLPDMQNRELYDTAPHPAAKSDIMRLELVYQYGGVSMDTDYECLKNIEPLLENETCVLSRMTDKPICNGFIAALPGDPFLKRCIDELPNHLLTMTRNAGNIYFQTGPGYIDKFWRDYSHIKILEPHIVYPYEPRTPKEKALWQEQGAAAFPDSYAAHHWTGSWLKR